MATSAKADENLPGKAKAADNKIDLLAPRRSYQPELEQLKQELSNPAMLIDDALSDRIKLVNSAMRYSEMAINAGDTKSAKGFLVAAARAGEVKRAITRLLLFKHTKSQVGVLASDAAWKSIGLVQEGDIVITETVGSSIIRGRSFIIKSFQQHDLWGITDENRDFMVASCGDGAVPLEPSTRPSRPYERNSFSRQNSTMVWSPPKSSDEFVMPSAPPHSLIGKVGDESFYVGALSVSEVELDGDFQLIHNCDATRQQWTGVIHVSIYKIRALE